MVTLAALTKRVWENSKTAFEVIFEVAAGGAGSHDDSSSYRDETAMEERYILPLPGEIIYRKDAYGNTLIYYTGSTINAPIGFIPVSPEYYGGTALVPPEKEGRPLADKETSTNEWLRKIRERGYGEDWIIE